MWTSITAELHTGRFKTSFVLEMRLEQDKNVKGYNQGFIELGHRGFVKLFSSKGGRERHTGASEHCQQPLGRPMKQQLEANTFTQGGDKDKDEEDGRMKSRIEVLVLMMEVD